MTMLDDMAADPTHYMHGTTKGFQLGCRCWRCSPMADEVGNPDATSRWRGGKAWTAEEDEWLAEMVADGLTVAQIADKLKRTKMATQAMLQKRGLHAARANGWTADEIATLISMRREGRSAEEIADAVGRSDKAVLSKVAKLKRECVDVPWVKKQDTHGTVNCYEAGCRCPECKAAAAAERRRRKMRKKRESA